jgi:HSP20 family molecular chaperone IbpA
VHTKEAHEDELKNQHQRFQSVYQKNENAQRDSLNIQKVRYVKELNETRKDFVKAANKYENKEADPFYKVEDRGSYLRENPDFYVLRAYVPEHEKDVVKVTIQNDKATISGQRSFKDRLEDDGKIVSSANFQTFREEFPFEKPVITEGMTRERQGDWVVYQIPKGLANRLNRKA